MTKEKFYEKWRLNGFYQHNPLEFMANLNAVIKTEQSGYVGFKSSLQIHADRIEQHHMI